MFTIQNLQKVQLKALNGSIRHYRESIRTVRFNIKSGQSPMLNVHFGQDYCDLCREFNPVILLDGNLHDNCHFCPIMIRTGQKYCHGTPFIDIIVPLLSFFSEIYSETSLKEHIINAITAELDFLLDLKKSLASRKSK
jgi:hypothetical protein